MVAAKRGVKEKRSKKVEGDLFPRGKAEGSVARVKKRDGTVLFGGAGGNTEPKSKKARNAAVDAVAGGGPISKMALSGKRLAIGMTLLGVVTASSERGVEIALPSGLRATADPLEVLVEQEGVDGNQDALGLKKKSKVDSSDEDTDEDSDAESRVEDDDSQLLPLWRVLSPGDVVRSCVLSTERASSGLWLVRVTCRPSLINVSLGMGSVTGARAATALRKGELMWGAVKTVEDHGYVVDFGPSVTSFGFLSFEDAGHSQMSNSGKGTHTAVLRPGSPVEALVMQTAQKAKVLKKVVRVCSRPEQVNSAVSLPVDEMTVASIRAGTRVHARISRVDSEGSVEISFLGLFSAVVERAHLPHDMDVSVGAKGDARLLYVDANSKRIGASFLPALVENRKPRNFPAHWQVGHVISSAVVERVDPNYGVYLAVTLETTETGPVKGEKGSSTSVPLFAHSSRVSDDNVDNLSSVFHSGLRVENGIRVISFSHLDGVVNVDLRASILSRKALSLAEVEPGRTYKCKITDHSQAGSLLVSVDCDPAIRGVVPASEVSDTTLSRKSVSSSRRFKVGEVLSCVCMSVEAKKSLAVLTARKSVVKAQYPLLASYEQAQEALLSPLSTDGKMHAFTGCVAAVTKGRGILIVFANNVRGLVNCSDLIDFVTQNSSEGHGQKGKGLPSSDLSLEQLETLYPRGRVVSVRPLKVKVAEERLLLSLNLQGPRDEANRPGLALTGSVVTARVVSVDADERCLRMRAKVPSGGDPSQPAAKAQSSVELDCVLPFGHLSDFSDLSKRLGSEYAKLFSNESSPIDIGDALVLPRQSKVVSSQQELSVKPSLLAARKNGKMPMSFEDIEALCHETSVIKTDKRAGSEDTASKPAEGPSLLHGYVKTVHNHGVSVGVGAHLSGFAKNGRLSDDFVASPSGVLEKHQSVCAVVDQVDKEKKNFTVSLRTSDVGTNALVEYTKSFFSSLSSVTERFGKPPVERDFPIGAIVTATLDTSRPYGKVFNLESSNGSKAYGVVLNSSGTAAPSRGGSDSCGRRDECDDSESIASAAASTAVEYASKPNEHLEKRKSRGVAPSSTRKTRRQHAQSAADQATGPVPARVLDVDPFSGVVDVSVSQSVVASAGKRILSPSSDICMCSILLLKDEYVILSVPKKTRAVTSIAFAIFPIVRQHLGLLLKPGVIVPCRIISSGDSMRNLGIIDWQRVEADLDSLKKHRSSGGGSPGTALGNSPRGSKQVTPSTVSPGQRVSGKVTSSSALHLKIAIASGVAGRLHISNFHRLDATILDGAPVGPLSEEHGKKFQLPRTAGTKLSNLRVVANVASEPTGNDLGKPEKEDTPGKKEMTFVSLARGGSGDADSIAEGLPVGSKVLGFVKSYTADDCGGPLRIVLDVSHRVSAFCFGIDALCPEIEASGTDRASKYEARFSVGRPFVCVVSKEAGERKNQLNVSLSCNGDGKTPFFARVVSYKPGYGLRVTVPCVALPVGRRDLHWCWLGICDVRDDFDETVAFCASVKECDIVRVCFVPNASDDVQEFLSMRPSSLGTLSGAICDPPIPSSADTSIVGQACRGFVRSVDKHGCFLSVGRGMVARVLLSNLADEFVKEPKVMFPAGTLVSGKVSKFSDGKMELSLRKRKREELEGSNDVSEKKKRARKDSKRASVAVGSIMLVDVSSIETFGAVVKLPASTTALLHKTEADQDRIVADPWKEWKVGQQLVVVLIDSVEKGRLRVGTKRCYFEAAGLGRDLVDEILEANLAGTARAVIDNAFQKFGDAYIPSETYTVNTVDDSSDSDSMEKEDHPARRSEDSFGRDDDTAIVQPSTESSDDVENEAEGESESESESADEAEPDSADTLAISRGFEFDEGDTPVDAEIPGSREEDRDSLSNSSCSDDEETTEVSMKSSKRKREKKRAKEAAEREIRDREEALALDPDTPETAEDFERLLMGTPNASHVWIQYMAFRVTLSQTEKARALAERSLTTIDLTEELERVNMWLAYMNLEASHGPDGGSLSSKELSGASLRNRVAAVFRVFDRACDRVTDIEDLHLQAAVALREAHPDIADEVLHRASKKFKRSKDVWCAIGTAQFRAGQHDAARKTLERALLSLEGADKVAAIQKFAQLEYRHGSRERGRTVFASLCANFPKKLDIRSVHLDMEISQYRKAVEADDAADVEACKLSIRHLFEQCASLDMSTKKTKYFLKRWLDFEIETGDKDRQNMVKDKARAYVNAKLVSS